MLRSQRLGSRLQHSRNRPSIDKRQRKKSSTQARNMVTLQNERQLGVLGTPKAPKTPRVLKQKAASGFAIVMTPNDFAAGYDSRGETRTEEPTPVPAKKSRAPRNSKDKDEEPAAKKQKKSNGSKLDVKANFPTVFTDLFLAAGLPTGLGFIINKEGSDREDSADKKRKHEMTEGSDVMEDNGEDTA
ncbi:MAG: hypothetical protein Q9226_008993 [Calogaya cf. arnoldii]